MPRYAIYSGHQLVGEFPLISSSYPRRETIRAQAVRECLDLSIQRTSLRLELWYRDHDPADDILIATMIAGSVRWNR